MKLVTFAPLLSILVAATTPATFADAQGDLKTAYAGQCDSIVHGDWDAFKNSLSADYVGVNLSGPNDDRTSETTQLQQMKATFGITNCTVDIRSVKPGDNGATVVDLMFSMHGVAPNDLGQHVKKGDQLDFRFHSIDTWMSGTGGMIQSRAETQGVVILINGAVASSKGTV